MYYICIEVPGIFIPVGFLKSTFFHSKKKELLIVMMDESPLENV